MIRFGSITDWMLNAFKFGKKSYYLNNSYLFDIKGPAWIDVNQPYLLYNTIPQLKTAISRKAKMFSNMELKLVKTETGEVVEDKNLIKLLSNPNVLQSFNSFLEEYKIQEQVYGNQFTYKNKPSSLTKYPVAMWNISPRYIAPYLTGKMFDQTELEQIISHYVYNQQGNEKKYETSDILYSKINDLDNPIIGCSPIYSLQKPLSNIDGAYTFRNVIITEKGAIGILSNKSKDGMGTVPLSAKELEEIERKYVNSHGIGGGQRRIHVTNSGLEWSPMTFPTKDLMLFEEVEEDFMTIIDHFGLNANIFANKNSTYENVLNGIKITYQDTIQPEADEYAQSMTKFLQIEKGYHLEASYEHIKILQKDNQTESTNIKTKAETLNSLVSSGIILRQEAKKILANETDWDINNNVEVSNE